MCPNILPWIKIKKGNKVTLDEVKFVTTQKKNIRQFQLFYRNKLVTCLFISNLKQTNGMYNFTNTIEEFQHVQKNFILIILLRQTKKSYFQVPYIFKNRDF